MLTIYRALEDVLFLMNKYGYKEWGDRISVEA